MADFSSAASSGIQTAALTPNDGASIARDTPVDPAVPSVTRPPGRRSGSSFVFASVALVDDDDVDAETDDDDLDDDLDDASVRIAAATRSLTDPPGLQNSALARICVFCLFCVEGERERQTRKTKKGRKR